MRGFKMVEGEYEKNNGTILNLPRRGTPNSAGYDFYMPIDATIPAGARVLVWSDVRAYMLPDEVLNVYPRSSLGVKGLILSNTIGVIDSDYYSNRNTGGNIGLTLWNTTDKPFELRKGDRVCQGIFGKYLIADNDIPISQERIGGMGSTKA